MARIRTRARFTKDRIVHPRRAVGEDIRVWANRCFDAEMVRRSFIAGWVENVDKQEHEAEEDVVLRICCTYHEHATFPPQLPPTKLSEIRSVAGYWFHPDRNRCRTCCSSGGGVRYVVYDTETTGSSREDEVIQLGFVAFDGKGREVRRYEEVWRTSRPSNPWAQRVHGIPPEEVAASRVSQAEGLREFQSVLYQLREEGGLLIAHNSAFDHRLVQQTAHRAGVDLDWCVPEFCTAKALKDVPTTERGTNCKNGDVYQFVGGPDLGRMHRALVDARATAYIFFHGKDSGWWM